MTHDELVLRAVRWLRGRHNCGVVLAEITSAARSIPDAIGWRWSRSIMVECKTSRGDFRADRKKPAHRGDNLLGYRRWYLTPPGLVAADEVPEGWGLAVAHTRMVRVVVEAPRIHRTNVQLRKLQQEELRVLLSALRRHQIGVEWRQDVARFKPIEGEVRSPAEVLASSDGQRKLF